MNRNIFVVVFILILAVGGALWMSAKKVEAPVSPEATVPVPSATGTPEVVVSPESIGQNVPAAAPAALVQYSDEGFSPAAITVPVGTTVMFKNNSSGPMWVASAPHPAHTDYPEFDQERSVPSGGTYSFVFEKKGAWKYHDHLNPTRFGLVTVN